MAALTEAHDFGYSARKVASTSAATKANAVLLNLATRKARGTMGKKEKLKIKGTLVIPTEAAHAPPPIVSPPPPAPAVAPPAPVAVVAPLAPPSPAPAPTNGASVALTQLSPLRSDIEARFLATA